MTTIEYVPGNMAGTFNVNRPPKGVILHGSRSGQSWGIVKEYAATVNYVRNGAAGLGWNATIGIDELCIHLGPGAWGWNARGHSDDYLAVEFAQPRLGVPIMDGQVEAFCYWFREHVLAVWPNIPRVFPEHWELPAGQADGKTDVDPQRPGELARRIVEWLDGDAEEDADVSRIAELEAQVANEVRRKNELVNAVGYIRGDLMNKLLSLTQIPRKPGHGGGTKPASKRAIELLAWEVRQVASQVLD